MDSQWKLFAAILILDALLAFALAGMLARRARVKLGRAELAHSLMMLALWAFCYAMVILSTSLVAKSFWFKFEHVGIVSQPVFWFLFALNYTSLNKPLKWPWLIALWTIPAISLALVFSQNGFHLYYATVEIASDTGGPFIVTRGTFYWLQWIQSNFLFIVSAVLLLRWAERRAR